MTETEFQILRPFSPAIGKYKLPTELIKDLNNYVDGVISNKKLARKLDHGKNLAGEVSQEFLLSKEFLEKGLLKFLGFTVENYIKLSDPNKQIKNFQLISSWIVRQFKNEYNPVHWHGGHVSGVGYIKLPETFGDSFQKNKSKSVNGNISFIHGSRMFLCKSIVNYKPKVGDFYIFPNYLMHSVNPFYADGERRSISFNAYVGKDIYDVY